jgi:putative ABC transport system permease protein
MEPVKALQWLDLIHIGLMIAVVGAVVGVLRLGIVRRMAWASVRAAVQLAAVGWIIGWVFSQQTWYAVGGLLIIMTLIAGVTAGGQLGRRLSRQSLVLSGLLGAVTAVALTWLAVGAVGVDGWDARYLIPLGGMLLGNAMTAAVLATERMREELRHRRHDVEVILALGGRPWDAAHPAFARAVAAAMTPTINAMLVVGVVKLPGMMTGQMLGGTEPIQAAAYQLLILAGILFTDGLTAVAMAWWLFRRSFNATEQLRLNG